MSDSKPRIRIIANGPLRVTGTDLCRIGIERNQWKRPSAYGEDRAVEHAEAYSLCRCGASSNKPFCDGSHRDVDWDATETADRAPTATRRREWTGDGIAMTDDKSLCWHAGFCVREYGKAWDLVGTATGEKETTRVRDMIHACPSSRLQFHAPPGSEPVEPELAPRVALIDDGPLFVQGDISLESADGETYEPLNRMSLCRCGASANKPYCDGTHSSIDFKDPA